MEQRRKLAGALNRMMKLKMSQAWEQWQFWYEEIKAQQFKLAGALNRMLKRQLSKAWEQWQYWYEQIKDQQFRLAGALNRMMKRQLSKAWEQWQYWYEQIKDQQFRLAGALRRMQNLKLSQAWESWQAWYADMMEQKRKLAGAMNRMMNLKLSQAWESWQAWYADMMEQKRKLAGALHRMRHRKLSQAWEQWQWFYEMSTMNYTRCCICSLPAQKVQITSLIPGSSADTPKSAEALQMRFCEACAEKYTPDNLISKMERRSPSPQRNVRGGPTSSPPRRVVNNRGKSPNRTAARTFATSSAPSVSSSTMRDSFKQTSFQRSTGNRAFR